MDPGCQGQIDTKFNFAVTSNKKKLIIDYELK